MNDFFKIADKYLKPVTTVQVLFWVLQLHMQQEAIFQV